MSPELRAALGGGTDLVYLQGRRRREEEGKEEETGGSCVVESDEKMNKRNVESFTISGRVEKKDRTKIYDKMKKNAISRIILHY